MLQPRTAFRALSLLILALLPAAASATSHMWTTRTQVSNTDYGAIVEWIEPGRADSVSVYAALRIRGSVDGGPNWNQGGLGYLIALRPNSAWAAGWTLRERFTESSHFGTDFHMVVDRDDDCHVVHEGFGHGDDDPPATTLNIAYKNRSASNWGAGHLPIIVGSESGDEGTNYPCASLSPHLFLQETSTADTLHVTYRRGSNGGLPCSTHPNWLTYRRTPRLASNKWRTEGESFVTGEFGSGPVAVDDEGIVHFVGTNKDSIEAYEFNRFTVLHVSGRPPDAGQEWPSHAPDWRRDVLYVSSDSSCSEPELDPGLDLSFDAPSLRGANDFLYIAFHAFVDCKREVFLTRIDTSDGSVDTPVQITPSDGMPSVRPNLEVAPDGSFHLMFCEPHTTGLSAWQPGMAGDIFHMWTTEDPMTPSNWSSAEKVTFERRNMAQWPEFHASGDSVWTIYSCHDDDVFQECDSGHSGPEQDCDWEIWAQQRLPIPDVIPSGQTMTWKGRVYLDADFRIPATCTLVIEPGTLIFVAATDARNQGIDAGRIEIIVEGDLVAPGSAADSIVVRGATGTGAGEWYGFRFVGAPVSGSPTTLSYVNVRNAYRGITADTLGFNLYDCRFAQSENADIYMDRDFRIPEGKEFELLAPTKVLVAATDAAPKPWGQDSAKSEILVEGGLRTLRPEGGSASDSVRFVATSLGPSKWTGITITEGATGQIYDAVIGGAADPVAFLGAAYGRVWNTRIFDFTGVGILDWASNAWIKGCSLRKAIAQVLERKGIQLTSSTGRVESNDVGFMEKWGIRAEFDASFCNASVAGDTLVIAGNTVTGNYAGGVDEGPATGISVERGCDHRHPRIRNNIVTKWSRESLELVQCAETQVSENVLNESFRGFQYVRNSNAAGGVVRVFRNDLQRNKGQTVRTTESFGLAFREVAAPDSAGGNRLRQFDVNAKNFEASDPLVVIDAERNLWLRPDSTVITDTTEIRATLEEDPAGRVDIARPLSSGGGPTARLALGEVSIGEDGTPVRPPDVASVEGALPTRFRLGPVRPNPFPGALQIRYEVPAGSSEAVFLTIYDVAGRVVRELAGIQRSPGRHETAWDGATRNGARAASGIFFVRLQAGDFRQTERVVLLRSGER